jgi:hypothetical protein
MRRAFALLFIALLAALNSMAQSTDPKDIVNRVFDRISTIHTLCFKLHYKERVYENGKYRNDSSFAKYQKAPRREYIKVSNGTELLWGPDINGGDVLVHPNSFPYFNINLNPDGYYMRKNQHHGIDEMGFDYFKDLVQSAIDRAGKDFNKHFFYQGEITYNAHQCIQLVIIDPEFKYAPYTAKKGETVLSLARSMHLNEYMILKRNPKISSYTESLKEGQSIQLPTNYGMLVTLYIDKDMLLPVMMRVDDDKGLFEQYDYDNLKLNPTFQDGELTRDYKGYHF